MSNDRYVSPLSERYASREMQYIFSPDKKFRTWRKLWIALAETEKELGLNITDEQIEELKAHAEDINYDVAKEREKVVRHDVMSHVYAYGVQCPKAKGIIHLGATSCYVGDNTDMIVMSEALKLVRTKLVNVIAELAKFADAQKCQPTLAFTHFQPAQPTTVGKRATLWLQEFEMDLEDLDYVLGSLKLLGSKGTTGTQASFLELFDGDQETIDKIDPMIAEKMGFKVVGHSQDLAAAYNLDRPGLKALTDAVKEKKVHSLLVMDSFRISLDSKKTAAYGAFLQSFGVRTYSPGQGMLEELSTPERIMKTGNNIQQTSE